MTFFFCFPFILLFYLNFLFYIGHFSSFFFFKFYFIYADTGCLGLGHWDDPEGGYGEGGGRRVQDGEHMYTCGGFILTFFFFLFFFF